MEPEWERYRQRRDEDYLETMMEDHWKPSSKLEELDQNHHQSAMMSYLSLFLGNQRSIGAILTTDLPKPD